MNAPELCTSLVPRPQRVAAGEGSLRWPQLLAIELLGLAPSFPALVRWRARMTALGRPSELLAREPATHEARVELRIELTAHTSTPPESYLLAIHPTHIELCAGDEAGIAHGLATLEQLVRAASDADGRALVLPALVIEDQPDFPVRGLVLDISRSKLPTPATLKTIVELCAELKLNQLQLYTEHTFAYREHARVYRESGALDATDIRALDAWCREHHIELVPNQQSFGHMHRWLTHEPYAHLAEVPEGIEHAWSREREPFGLCAVDPESLVFLEGLYDELLPNFTSAQFNVNLDETIDLGLGRSRAACEQRGKGRVYLEFLRAVHERVVARGRRMQFWGDIVLAHPELLHELPRDAIALAWGYDAEHPFERELAQFAACGLAFYVCPGTSSWQSIAGRTHNALLNLRNAAQVGRAHGARGFLITDWGDRGHLQPWSASYAGLCAGAARAWNASNAPADNGELARVLDLHVFQDAQAHLGAIACGLGDVYLETEVASTNGSALFFLLAFAAEPLPHTRLPGLSRAGLARARARIDELLSALERVHPASEHSALATSELCWAARLMRCACDLGAARLAHAAHTAELPAAQRRALELELRSLIDEHRRLWLARNSPGGLRESADWLERVATLLSTRG